VEHFFERTHGAIGQHTGLLYEEISHFTLPAFVNLARRHSCARPFKVFSLQISDQ